jgi:hypothetical protein
MWQESEYLSLGIRAQREQLSLRVRNQAEHVSLCVRVETEHLSPCVTTQKARERTSLVHSHWSESLFSSAPRQMPGYYFKLCHKSFLLYPFQFIIQHRPTIQYYVVGVTKRVIKQTTPSQIQSVHKRRRATHCELKPRQVFRERNLHSCMTDNLSNIYGGLSPSRLGNQ